MRRVTITSYDQDEDEYNLEWISKVPHPPNFTTANNILTPRLQAHAAPSTNSFGKVGICILAYDSFTNLHLFKEWL